ncbi:MAG: hypothetical protein CL912_09275 [Deltaproteobacteria bacterium]|nr:hypothetical protein [Deltaproteobacteria bacterium]
MLLVSRGSDGNIDAPTSQITSGRSQIRAFSISGTSNAPVAYTAGEVIAWGLRNSVGMSEDISTGGFVSLFLSLPNIDHILIISSGQSKIPSIT